MTNLTVNQIDTRSSLAATTGQVSGQEVLLTERGREGTFRWLTGDQSSFVTSDPQQGVYVAPSSMPNGSAGAWMRVHTNALRPEYFGATADGATNDTDAFAALAAYIQARRGGMIEMAPGATYIVGKQGGPTATIWRYTPTDIIKVDGCLNAIIIRGNGARLKCAPGQKYGAFEADGTASPGQTVAVYPNGGKRSTPYTGMIDITNCSGDVVIENLILDGNQDNLIVGGGYSDSGIQIPMTGLSLTGNTGSVRVESVVSHDHGLDGAQISSPTLLPASARHNVVLTDVTLNQNGRQGLSLTGSRGLTATNCKFNNTGYGRIVSGPAAGLDIEAEGGNINRDSVFTNCEFLNNKGQGFVADSGDSADVLFQSCRFVSGNFWSIWPRMPGLKFIDCRIVGPMIAPWYDGGVASNKSTQFIRCEFTNDPVYGQGGGIDGFLFNGGAYATAALFEHCEFRAVGTQCLQGIAGVTTRFESCRFSQEADGTNVPLRGTFTGDNVATGPGVRVAEGSLVYDRFYINGVKQAVTP